MATKFDKPIDFSYNSDIQSLVNVILQLSDAVNKLEEEVETKSNKDACNAVASAVGKLMHPAPKAPVKKATSTKK